MHLIGCSRGFVTERVTVWLKKLLLLLLNYGQFFSYINQLCCTFVFEFLVRNCEIFCWVCQLKLDLHHIFIPLKPQLCRENRKCLVWNKQRVHVTVLETPEAPRETCQKMCLLPWHLLHHRNGLPLRRRENTMHVLMQQVVLPSVPLVPY